MPPVLTGSRLAHARPQVCGQVGSTGGGHLRPRTTGRQTLSEARLPIGNCGRGREPSYLELTRSFPSLPEVISRLHPQPRLPRRPKRLRQPNRHLRRHRRFLLHQFRQLLPAHPQPFGGLRNRKPRRLEAHTPHHPTRMRRPNHPHPSTPLNPTDQPPHPHRPHAQPGTAGGDEARSGGYPTTTRPREPSQRPAHIPLAPPNAPICSLPDHMAASKPPYVLLVTIWLLQPCHMFGCRQHAEAFASWNTSTASRLCR